MVPGEGGKWYLDKEGSGTWKRREVIPGEGGKWYLDHLLLRRQQYVVMPSLKIGMLTIFTENKPSQQIS